MKIVMSSGHGEHIRGAAGPPPWGLDEVDEARRVVEQTAVYLREHGVEVITYHDNVSTTQNENLNRIVDFHNSKSRDYDISIHFNAYQVTSNPRGTECFYVTQHDLAAQVSAAIAEATELPNRGAKDGSGLFFLAHTAKPALLVEVVFVDSSADAAAYQDNFIAVCEALADTLAGEDSGDPDQPDLPERPERPERPPPVSTEVMSGKVSWFGGPMDQGVSASEGLAFISSVNQKPELFLPTQPPNTTGLARRLNPCVHFLAMRWDYSQHSKTELLTLKAFVRNPKTGFGVACFPADWGPNEATGRLIDVSESVMTDLGLKTDDIVEVEFPYEGEST